MGSVAADLFVYPERSLELHAFGESVTSGLLSETQVAYLAGIIDGEGTIGIYGGNPSVPAYYHLVLIITNTHEALIDSIRGWIGGAKAPTKPRESVLSPGWQLVLWQHRASGVIRLCRPYLIVKSAQADLALEFMENWVGFRGRSVPEAEVERRKAYALRMRDLNQPGYQAGLRRWKGRRVRS